MTKVLRDTGISELMRVSAGDLEVLGTLTDEFRKSIRASRLAPEPLPPDDVMYLPDKED